MKKLFKYLIPGFVFLILFGCEFEDPTVEGPSPLSSAAANAEMALRILKFKNADTDKHISLHYANFAIGPEHGLEGTPILRLEGFNNSSDCRGELIFGQHRVNCDVESARAGMGVYPEVFDEALFQYLGQEVEISFSNPAYRLSDSGKPTLYILDAIVMTSPVRNRENGHTPALRQGLTLQWQARPGGGDFIIVACDANSITRPISYLASLRNLL
jgi:hypothetical protein